MRIPSDEEICRRIDGVEDTHLRMMFRYQKLTLGRISEVCGQYAPTNEDCFFDEDMHGNEYALFVVKTAKRKGRLRPVMRPLDTRYDAWAKEVAEYFVSQPETYPWLLHENPETSKTYAMKHARRMLDGLSWPMIDYTRAIRMPYDPGMMMTQRFNDKGLQEYLVELPDGSRAWTTDEREVSISFKVEQRWKHATSHCLRKRESLTLLMDYKFSGIDLAIVGGWTEQTQAEAFPPALKHYLFLDIQEARDNLMLLKDLGGRYFPKLLVPRSTFNR